MYGVPILQQPGPYTAPTAEFLMEARIGQKEQLHIVT